MATTHPTFFLHEKRCHLLEIVLASPSLPSLVRHPSLVVYHVSALLYPLDVHPLDVVLMKRRRVVLVVADVLLGRKW